MSAVAAARPETTLEDVPWDAYVRLRQDDATRHVRMTYHDGTLILISPEYLHDQAAERLGMLVREMAIAFNIEVAGTRTTTLKRAGDGDLKGNAKEPDNAFYIGANEALIRGKATIDLEIDPPPDLAIEVDNKSDSSIALPTYVGLRVPELWRYKVREQTLWFGALDGGQYREIDRSLCLPMLTPAMILAALQEAEDSDETTWALWLRGWAAGLPGI